MGGTFRIPIQTFATLQECWDVLLQCGVPYERIFAATSETVSQGGDDSTIESGALSTPFSFSSPMHTDIDWIATTADQHGYYNSAIIIGREGSGLRSEIRNAVTKGLIKSVHVAMEGGMESLNAAICGSVIMFEYARQKREYTRGTNLVVLS
jgi:TrmH family RNA methyltransferase